MCDRKGPPIGAGEQLKSSSDTDAKTEGLHMNNKPEAPQWMKDIFYELSHV
jgi:hypothetical protein